MRGLCTSGLRAGGEHHRFKGPRLQLDGRHRSPRPRPTCLGAPIIISKIKYDKNKHAYAGQTESFYRSKSPVGVGGFRV